jgi:signal transduction histidine kinase
VDDEMAALKRIIERERTARKSAERIAELKTRALAEANLDLELKVRNRTEDLQEARDRALRANEAKMNFLANISHDIRTPLNGIIGIARIVLDSDLNGQQREELNLLLKCSESLTVLLNDVLDVAKIESNSLELVATTVDVRQLLQELLAVSAVQTRGLQLELRSVVAEDVPQHLDLDPGRLRQILFNLLGNAVKFTRQGFIEVRVSFVDQPTGYGQLQFEVEDSGCGIAAEALDSVFQSFVQLRQHDQVREGAGLGLAISKSLAELMQGSLSVRSVLGQGTCFTLTMKVSKAEAPALRAEPLTSELPCLRILLVEDNPLNRMVAERLLRKWNQDVVSVNDGSQAVQAALAEPWDLILMDIAMPIMDGMEATRQIRAQEKGRRTPIFALTAHALDEVERSFLEVGMDGTVLKPIRLEALRETLSKVISSQVRENRS